jgi:hypothetical protein
MSPEPGHVMVLPATLVDRILGIPGALWVSPKLPEDLLARRAFDLHFSLMSSWLAATRQGLRLARVHTGFGLAAIILGAIAGANAVAESAPGVVASSALGASVLTAAQTLLRAGAKSAGFKSRARHLLELAERVRRLMQYERHEFKDAEVIARLDRYTETFYELQRESVAASE